nr:hypothetical protein [Tanacetum cinerariifolium]
TPEHLSFFIISSIAVQTPGSGISNLLAVGTSFTGRGNLYFQWELSPGRIEICRTATGTHLSQRKYILDLWQDSGLTACKLNPSPLLTSLHLSLDKGIPLTDDGAYRRSIAEDEEHRPTRSSSSKLSFVSFIISIVAGPYVGISKPKSTSTSVSSTNFIVALIVKQLNLKGKYGASDKFFTELLGLLKKMLPTGVDTYDASTKENFNLCVVVLWTINDYPTLEKNVCESLVRTLLNVPGKTKDGMNARLDLAELGIKPELFARHEEDKTTLPPIGYILTNAKKDIFCETLSNIRVPQGYCSNFSSLVSLKDRKIIGLKSHDYHMLMQEFLPIVIRLIMHPPTRYAIIRFCFFFKVICRKEISLQELDELQLELVMTLCLLEKFFPLLRERELVISKYSVSETVRWISYGLRATIVKYEAYNINAYTFRTKSNDGIVYQNTRVSVEAVDLYISKEVATTRKAFYYGVLQEIWKLLLLVQVNATGVKVTTASTKLLLLEEKVKAVEEITTEDMYEID